MQMTMPRMNITISSRVFFGFGIVLLLLLASHPAFAGETKGGGLPFDTWLETIRGSVTGPFAFTAAIIGLVGAGAALIFGGELNGFLRSLIFIVLVLAFLVAAENTLKAITGTGAELAAVSQYVAARFA